MNFDSVDVQKIEAEWLTDKQLSLDILRLDKIHGVVSGNKWFKLKYYMGDALTLKKDTIATFGGAWSNHIIAAAFAAREAGLLSVGIIRGEKPEVLSYTLQRAEEYGMQLHFVSREEYKNKEAIKHRYALSNWYWIHEGGYGTLGAKGAAEISQLVRLTDYTHIIAAVGTGTMLAGLISKSNANQKVTGISSMKGNKHLDEEIKTLLINPFSNATFEIKHEYHFGGYGKHTPQLIDFINEVYREHHLPLDIVYTGKTFYAIKDLAENNFFEHGSKLLMIHSGGLQGNKSLLHKVLAF